MKNSSVAAQTPPPVSAPSGDVGSRFAAARRTESLGRLRRGTFLLLPPLTLALAIDVRIFGDTTPVRALALIGMLGLAALTHVAVGQRTAGRRAIPIAIVFVVTLGVLLLGVLVETPSSRDAHMGAISALMMGAAIVIPWGVGPQLFVAVALAGAYALLPGNPIHDAGVVDLLVTLVDCVALSTVGAYVLDRQRRIAFVEREQARAMTAHRELLLDASRELNGTLDLDTMATSITAAGRMLVGGDTVALILVDDRRDVLRTVAVAGDLIESDREVINLEVPVDVLRPLITELRARGVARTSDERWAAMAELLRDHFGVLASLYVAIERSGRLLGYLCFNHRTAPAEFSDEQVRLARGFAAQCAIALANARLVADLQRANRVKTEFVSTMSHELRTPLSVMLGYTDVLDDAVADDEARVVVARIRSAGRELLDLIETTLDLNRLESGQDPANLESVGMRELWDELATQFQAIGRPPGVVLRWEANSMPLAHTDRRKLKIIVKNLVGNALKFTAAGEVVASVRPAGDRCLVVVRDTGKGIPAEHLPGIFEMFRQVDNTDRRPHGGVGLGLYIVRKLAEQLGATLNVASTVGKGTTFTLSLPSGEEQRAAAA